MSKTLKIFLIVLTACLAMAGIAAWYASSFIKPTQLTKLLSSSIHDATGRELTISGPVSLNLFPAISVRAERVALSNASWASKPNLLTVKQIDLDIKFWPLLKGSVEIGRLGLTGLEANLLTNQNGVGNWSLSPIISEPNQSSNQTGGSSSAANGFIAFKEIDLVDANIHYQEGNQAEKLIKIPKLSLDTDDEKSEILMDLQYAQYALNLKGKTSSLRIAYFNWDQSPVKLDLDLSLSLNGKSLAIAGQIDKKPKIFPELNLHLNSQSFDLAPLAGSAALAANPGKSSPVNSHKPQGKYFFSDEPLPFNLIPLANGVISIDIAQLGIPGQAPLTNLKTTLQLNKNNIAANNLSLNVGRGSAEAQIAISGFDSTSPKITTKGVAKGFSLEQLFSKPNSGAKVAGGEVHVAWNLQGSGLSTHQLMSRSSGLLQISVGQGKLNSQFINEGGDFLISILNMINPLYKNSTQTTLECAVAFLPINNGMINIQDSVGIETDRLDITLSGTINLATEALNIGISPKEKSGLTTGLDLGGLVKITGTLQNPQTGVNKVGVVNSAVSVGLGILTGGISIAAENAKSLTTKSQTCKSALHPWSEIYSASK